MGVAVLFLSPPPPLLQFNGHRFNLEFGYPGYSSYFTMMKELSFIGLAG
jgi:hypothetical protein